MTAPTATPARPPSPPRRATVLLAVVFVLVVISFGAAQLLSQAVHGSSTTDTVLTAAAAHLSIRTGRGDVTVVPSPDGDVHVRTDARFGLRAPQLVEDSTPAGVRLEADCHGFLGSGCEVSYTVAVPPAFDVTVSADSGDVTVPDLGGRLDTDVSSGDVRLAGLSGDVAVRAASGDITATGLRSGSVRAETAAGDVTLAAATAPRALVARTSSGNVDVGLPSGRSYRVDVESPVLPRPLDAHSDGDARHPVFLPPELGRRLVTVATDPASDATVVVGTDAGDITVHPS